MIGSNDEIWLSEDDGLTWVLVTPPSSGRTWDYVCAVATDTFLVVSSNISFRKVFRTDDLGTSWTDVTPINFDAGSIPKNPATDFAGVVLLPKADSSIRWFYSVDYGETYTEYEDDLLYSGVNFLSYVNGIFVAGLVAPGIAYSADGTDNSWMLNSYSGLYSGSTDLTSWDGTYYWSNSRTDVRQTRTADLAVDPSFAAGGDQKVFNVQVSTGNTTIFVGTEVFGGSPNSGVYTTTGSLTLTTRQGPAALDTVDFNMIAAGPSAAPPAAPIVHLFATG